MNKRKAYLKLENGCTFRGFSFGGTQPASGEVVFNTAMTGYPESLTDPSYSGQILVLTFPMIGNYGIPPMERKNNLLRFFESEQIHIRALVVADYTHGRSHWNAASTLDEWLKAHHIPGIYGVDTREITRILRESGTMPGKLVPEGSTAPAGYDDPAAKNLVAACSCNEVITYGNGKHRIVLVDCGCKNQIIRCLLERDATVIRVPWDYDFSALEYDGLLISNGPGNPAHCTATVRHIRKAFAKAKPIFGICMGNQLLATAAGATTYKLKYGHRSHNQPARMAGTNRVYITSQNHGYAVDTSALSNEWEPFFINLNDGTNEGIRHKHQPFFSVQFHPEATAGPVDTEFLFDTFIKEVALCKK